MIDYNKKRKFQVILNFSSLSFVLCTYNEASFSNTSRRELSADSANLYWIDLYDFDKGDQRSNYYGWTYIRPFSDDNCPFIDESWSKLFDVEECKLKCMEMNKNWDRIVDKVPPCTSITWDSKRSECNYRRCLEFPLLRPEYGSIERMSNRYPLRYGEAKNLISRGRFGGDLIFLLREGRYIKNEGDVETPYECFRHMLEHCKKPAVLYCQRVDSESNLLHFYCVWPELEREINELEEGWKFSSNLDLPEELNGANGPYKNPPTKVEDPSKMVIVHEHCGFDGRSWSLGLGDYNFEDLSNTYGIPENDISGFEILDGFVVEIFREDDFKGRSYSMEVDTSLCDVGWNDEVSSLRIKIKTTTPTDVPPYAPTFTPFIGNHDYRMEEIFIQDYFLNLFNPSGDSRCYTDETLRRIGEVADGHQNPGIYVCESDKEPGSTFKLPDSGGEISVDLFWDKEAPIFHDCWEGMTQAIEENKYLTYWFAVRVGYDWVQHFKKYEKYFNQLGYFGVRGSIDMIWDQANWIFRKQFRMNLRINQVVIQREDSTWPPNRWRPGDSGIVTFTGSGGGGGVAQLCTDKGLHVGGKVFKENWEDRDNPLYDFDVTETLAHELGHQIGYGHGPVYMPDIMTTDGSLSFRRCRGGVQCPYRSFLPFTEVNAEYNYNEKVCSYLKSDEAASCSTVEKIKDPIPTSSPISPDACLVGADNFLCPTGDSTCKYRGGGDKWNYSSSCNKFEGYTDIMLQRDPPTSDLLSEASKNACKAALEELRDIIGIDIIVGTNIRRDHIFSFYSYNRPPGCYIECDGGRLSGFFNKNAGSYITENTEGHYAQSLCVKESTVPNLIANPTSQLTPYPTKLPTLAPSESLSETPNSFSEICFAGDTNKIILNGELREMKNAKIGDIVMVDKDGNHGKIYSFGHYLPDVKITNYIRIEGVNSERKITSIVLSEAHMVLLENKEGGNIAIRSDKVRIGDKLITIKDGPSFVSSISRNHQGVGAYAPFTDKGTIVVNGVVVSCYIALMQQKYLGFLSHHFVAYLFESPHRLYCYLVESRCRSEKYTEDGLSYWVAVPLQIFNWILGSNVLIQIILTFPTLIVLVFFNLLECVAIYDSLISFLLLLLLILLKWRKRKRKNVSMGILLFNRHKVYN